MPLPPALHNVLEYYRPLATLARSWAGSEALLAPGTNLLGANALYASDPANPALLEAGAWARAQQWPMTQLCLGNKQGSVARLRWGRFAAQPVGSPVQVEQLSRLHLPLWAGVLAEAYGEAEWATPLARHLASRLEGAAHMVLLAAYAGSEAVGALLWQPSGAHLWGTLDSGVDAALLSAAAELSGGEVLVSLPDTSPLTVTSEQELAFVRL